MLHVCVKIRFKMLRDTPIPIGNEPTTPRTEICTPEEIAVSSAAPAVAAVCYKTKFCRHILDGCCPFGLYCSFAHTKAELRTIVQNQQEGINTIDKVREIQNAIVEALRFRTPPTYNDGLANACTPPVSINDSTGGANVTAFMPLPPCAPYEEQGFYYPPYQTYSFPYESCPCSACAALYNTKRDAEIQTC